MFDSGWIVWASLASTLLMLHPSAFSLRYLPPWAWSTPLISSTASMACLAITVSAAVSLSIIAFQAGNAQISIFMVLIVAAVLGFMVLNFPLGKIFLGDGGAYALGHLLVWSAIILINSNSKISHFAILLVFFWPVADTSLAIWRRWKLGNPADRPDRLHFHQLAMRFLEIRFFGLDKREIANPVATLILMPLISVPQVLGVLFWDDFTASVLSTFGVGFLFVSTYLIGIGLAKRGRITNV